MEPLKHKITEHAVLADIVANMHSRQVSLSPGVGDADGDKESTMLTRVKSYASQCLTMPHGAFKTVSWPKFQKKKYNT